MKKIFLFLIVALLISPFISNAAPDDPPPGFGMGDPGEPVPFDGGLSVLLAAGAAYGAKKFKEARGKETKQH